MHRIGIVGWGYVGKAYHKLFPEAIIYDPKHPPVRTGVVRKNPITNQPEELLFEPAKTPKTEINKCDLVLVCVPTDPKPNGELDMSIVEEVINWIEAPLILIKSALQPGTVDGLVKKTGKKIAVSVEYIGMGNYYLDPTKYPDPKDPSRHKSMIIGGERATAEACASILWAKMSPDTRIHLVSAREAEIVKLVENFYGAMKVTFANCLYSLTKKSGKSFIEVHQAWSQDGRTDPMHTRVNPANRGWQSHCYDKDIRALEAEAKKTGAKDMATLVSTIIQLNQEHLSENKS